MTTNIDPKTNEIHAGEEITHSEVSACLSLNSEKEKEEKNTSVDTFTGTGKSNAGKYDCPRCIFNFPDKVTGMYHDDQCLSCKCGDNYVARERNAAEKMYDAYNDAFVPKE